jgi:hypothetical protein
VEVAAIPQISGIPSNPDVAESPFRLESKQSLKPLDPKHPSYCWKLVPVKIEAIPQFPRIPSIPDVAGMSFRWKSQQSLKSLESQASLMLLEARSSNIVKILCNGGTRYRCSSANHVRNPWLRPLACLRDCLLRALLCKNCVVFSKTNVL